jgi:hypothetical protein
VGEGFEPLDLWVMSKPVVVRADSPRLSSPVSAAVRRVAVSHRVSGRSACPRRLYYTRYYSGGAWLAGIGAAEQFDGVAVPLVTTSEMA